MKRDITNASLIWVDTVLFTLIFSSNNLATRRLAHQVFQCVPTQNQSCMKTMFNEINMFETTNLARNGDETRVMLAKSNNTKNVCLIFHLLHV